MNVELSGAALRIRQARLKAVMSIEQVGKKTGIGTGTITEYELGKRAIPLAHYRKIMQATGTV